MPFLTNLADIARKAGLDVEEVPGWRTRGHGVMGEVQTITCHHTANGGAAGDAPSLRVVRDGRPGLTGPLAHFVLGRSGKVYVVAAGLAYHAGVSKLSRQTNGHAIGIEAEAVGTPGAPGDWPEAQMIAYARLCRALAVAFDVPFDHIQGHKETCAPAGRKSDPMFDMGKFRARIEATSLTAKTTKEEDDMANGFDGYHVVTEADVRAWYGTDPKDQKEGKHKVGAKVSYDELVRFPPATERLRRELKTDLVELRKLIQAKN